jgi:hypothetical protein
VAVENVMPNLEAKIVINGVELSLGQAMTMRVALTAFLSNLRKDGLGEDERGAGITKGYIDRGEEVFRLL